MTANPGRRGWVGSTVNQYKRPAFDLSEFMLVSQPQITLGKEVVGTQTGPATLKTASPEFRVDRRQKLSPRASF